MWVGVGHRGRIGMDWDVLGRFGGRVRMSGIAEWKSEERVMVAGWFESCSFRGTG